MLARQPTGRGSVELLVGDRRLASVLLAGVLTGCLDLGARSLVPRPDEPLPVRWARTAAGHPLRTWLALTLLFAAARKGTGTTDSTNLAERGREVGKFELH